MASISAAGSLPRLCSGKPLRQSQVRFRVLLIREDSKRFSSNAWIQMVDWDGYAIGYYDRIFEARNKTKGGSFVGDDKDFFKFRIGFQRVVPAFEEAIVGMSPGGVRG